MVFIAYCNSSILLTSQRVVFSSSPAVAIFVPSGDHLQTLIPKPEFTNVALACVPVCRSVINFVLIVNNNNILFCIIEKSISYFINETNKFSIYLSHDVRINKIYLCVPDDGGAVERARSEHSPARAELNVIDAVFVRVQGAVTFLMKHFLVDGLFGLVAVVVLVGAPYSHEFVPKKKKLIN